MRIFSLSRLGSLATRDEREPTEGTEGRFSDKGTNAAARHLFEAEMTANKAPRVLHYVHGGGTGSCRRVIALCVAHQRAGDFDNVLVFRGEPFDPYLPGQLETLGIRFYTVAADRPYNIIMKLLKLIRQVRPEVVVGHGYREHIHSRIAAVVAQIPVVIQVERNIEHYRIHTYLLSKILERYTWRVVCVSHAVRASLKKRFFDEKKLTVIYNGFDFSKLKPPSGLHFSDRENKAIMVARFSGQKDHDTLLRAFRLTLNSHPHVKLLLVGGADGNGEVLVAMEKLAADLNMLHAVSFVGKRDDVAELLWTARIFVMSTHFEGLCGAVIEAMAAGCAVIGTNVDGVAELIQHEHTGLLVEEDNAPELASQISYLLEHPVYAQQLARNGRNFVEAQFSLAKMADGYRRCFYEALTAKSGKRRFFSSK